MIVYILLSLGLISHVNCKAPICCSSVRNEECRTACQTLTTEGGQREQMEQLLEVSKSCASDQTEFWQCVNQSIQVVSSVAVWSGRPCCDLAKNRVCEQACREAKLQSEISESCGESLETNLYECVKKTKRWRNLLWGRGGLHLPDHLFGDFPGQLQS